MGGGTGDSIEATSFVTSAINSASLRQREITREEFIEDYRYKCERVVLAMGTLDDNPHRLQYVAFDEKGQEKEWDVGRLYAEVRSVADRIASLVGEGYKLITGYTIDGDQRPISEEPRTILMRALNLDHTRNFTVCEIK